MEAARPNALLPSTPGGGPVSRDEAFEATAAPDEVSSDEEMGPPVIGGVFVDFCSGLLPLLLAFVASC